MPRLPRPETAGPVLDHPVPTHEELYELLLLGLWYAHPRQQGGRVSATSLGHMANGIFTMLVQIGVMTEKYRESLACNYDFVMLVYGNCKDVRHKGNLRAADIKAYAEQLDTDLFVRLGVSEMYAHARVVANKGYRLYFTDIGYAKAEALAAKYPNLTQELFRYGWWEYARRVRRSDMSRREDPEGSAQ